MTRAAVEADARQYVAMMALGVDAADHVIRRHIVEVSQ